ncbi:acyltransferase [Ancylobacter sp. TS-1]|uniref:acyltransferase family protein n=1 Tax=Ancylobacter sp. TS-1 TaxID=1850374 RepID=UPI001265BCE6|nr:acyltransferase [Ancylobacter sp. TS-1]QFR33489.1 acyltransferase family protein [Ancylobacter sp. TS-1]
MAAPSQAPERLAGLQALRGIAAAAVYVQHVFAFADMTVKGPTDFLYSFHFGALGVYIFFALSAYLMAAKASDPPLKFALDRTRRVYPSLWIALAVSGVASLYFVGAHGTTWQLVLLIPAGPQPWANVPYWTLYFEMSFYVLMFVLIVVLRKYAVYGAIVALSVSYLLSAPDNLQNQIFPTGGAVLVMPLSIYFLAGLVTRLLPRPRLGSGVVYALVGIALFYGIEHAHKVPCIGPLIAPYLGMIFVPVWAVAMGCFVRAALTWSAQGRIGSLMARLGDLSYGIYLVHMVPMSAMTYIVKWNQWPLSFWQVAALMFVSALPVSLAMGFVDVRLQRWLKAWTVQLPLSAIRRRIMA